MPWRERATVSLRHEFVVLAAAKAAPIEALCQRFGISRKTGYKWLRRYRADGPAALLDRSRRPRCSPRRTPETLEAQVLAVRDEEPVWGGRKIRQVLRNRGVSAVPSASTITAILRRHGRLRTAEPQPHAFIRFEHAAPNELWQMDFKGHIGLLRGGRCYPLTVLDDHSRFSLVLQALPGEQRLAVQQRLIEAFRRYGLPFRMTMDNGKPWGNQFGGYTRLSAWLIRLGVRVSHSRPYHPQTQGKDERFHRTLKAELLAKQPFEDLDACQIAFDRWRERYNLIRPHEAIAGAVPAQRYQPSPRPYPELLLPFEYAPDDQLRKTNRVGQFHFQGRVYRVSEAFASDTIALRPQPTDGRFEIFYCQQKIGELNLHLPPTGVTHVSEHL